MTDGTPAGTGGSGEPQRLSKLLAQRGIASRSEADRMIERGWVSVNGRVAQSGDRALPDAEITLSPEAQERLQSTVTVLLNKPRGFVSAPDETGGARAMSLLVGENFGGLGKPPTLSTYGLRVAGRLAVGDSGLVVYTTDTALARRLAADDVEESWRISFAEGIPAQAQEALQAAAADTDGTVMMGERHGDGTLQVTTSRLGKGALAELCATLGWQADLLRLRRGEVTLPDGLDDGQWQLRTSPA